MVDLSKHLAAAKQALERRNYDLVTERMEECQEIDPTNLELYKLLIDAAKRRAKEAGKKSMFASMGMPTLSKDPQKQLSGAIKKVSKSPDMKSLAAAGDAAMKVYQGGVKGMVEVAILLYEEVRATGMFSPEALWNLATLYHDRFKESKDNDSLEKALKTMGELERAMPNHAEAGRTIKNWEAERSMVKRTAGGAGDYRKQLSSDEKAHRQEAMNRIIRTVEDAREVIGYIDQDLVENPSDKGLYTKKGDILRRINAFAEARAAFEKAQQLDPHDFVVSMRLGDLLMEEAKANVATVEAAGGDVAAAQQQLLQVEIDEYRKRVERQPTEMTHRFSLGQKLFKSGQIEAAAAEFQQTVRDPRLRKPSHRILGACFTRKKLLDLAVQQYEAYLKLAEDDQTDEAKDVRFALGRVLEDQGKKEPACVHYQRLVELDLGYKDAAERLSRLREG